MRDFRGHWQAWTERWTDRTAGLHKARRQLLLGVAALGAITAISVAGHSYVKSNAVEVYHVYFDGQEIGTVTSPEIIEEYILTRYEELEATYPDVHMVLNADEIEFASKTAYQPEVDDESVLNQLGEKLVAEAVGVEVRVNDVLIGVVRDQETADTILESVKNKYVPEADKKKKNQVSILSVQAEEPALNVGETKLETVDFVEEVKTQKVSVEPTQIMNEEQIMAKLETGGLQPTQYVVQEGDCISCIADKLGITKEVIYENNVWIVEDAIWPGDILDVTEWQPTLSVKTIEIEKELQDVQFETIYQEDPEMKKGKSQVIQQGVTGKKIATYRLTKVNGKLKQEELVEEEVVEKPVAAIVKRGTKVVLGEGSGNFRWPVSGARVSSSYGMRWGELHQGIDLISKTRTIMAADNGKVEFAGWKNGYGNTIIINHNNGYKTLYGHLKSIDVKKGATVESGEAIGVMGSTGNSTGTHLHFEVIKNGVVKNPANYLSK